MSEKQSIYFSPEFIEVLKEQTAMSPETWHKIMNPFCPYCLLERGQEMLSSLETDNEKTS